MAHKLKIDLNYTNPKVYRTVVVPEHFTFDDLHNVIQNVMNWNDSHMYQFNLGAPYLSTSILLPEFEDDIDEFEAEDDDDFLSSFFGETDELHAGKELISNYFNGQYKKVTYTYDFGDDWIHTITVQKKPSSEILYPVCIKGENAAPIDDIGSYPGFYNIIDIMNRKKKSAEELEILECYGIPANQTYESYFGFDLDEVNEKLSEFFNPNLKK